VPDSFEALSVLVIALVPGALFVYALERQTGAWGSKFSDRLLRFIVISLVFELIAIPVSYVLWRQYTFPTPFFSKAQPFPWKLYHFTILYLAVPFVAGWFVGMGYDRRWPWVERVFRQLVQAPRAWDALFSRRPVGYVRMLIKVEPPTWVAGAFVSRTPHDRAWVGNFPEAPDIYCPIRLACHPETGEFIKDVDPTSGRRMVRQMAGSLLVDGQSIAYLEFHRGA
jgi:uncharacterized protein DUF6338